LATTGRGRGLIRGLSAAIAATAFGCIAQAEPVEGPPSTSQSDPGWFRYLNARFGLRVDLPENGFHQELSPNGSGITLTSSGRGITINVHANWLGSILPDATDSTVRSIASLHQQAVAETRQKGGNVTYSIRHNEFYVISGNLGTMVYYERVAISPACPDVFNAIRVKYPQAIERELDPLVTRVSSSLRAVCPSRIE
jgi:hypothetical protein